MLRQLKHTKRFSGPGGAFALLSSAFRELSRHSYSYCSTRLLIASIDGSVSIRPRCQVALEKDTYCCRWSQACEDVGLVGLDFFQVYRAELPLA